jgi:phosphoenolpyruvate carboxykinase (GTP)
MLERCAGRAGATETAIGNLPRPADLNTQDLGLAPGALESLLTVDSALWRREVGEIRKYLSKYGERLPAALTRELDGIEQRLG